MTTLKRPDHDPKVERYFPDVIAPAKEFKKLASAENPELKAAWDCAWEWMINTFVYDFTESGCRRWESMLGIIPRENETFEERRSAILLKIMDIRPFTERTVSNYISHFQGGENANIEVYPNDYSLACLVAGDCGVSSKVLINALRVYVPANLSLVYKWTDDLLFDFFAIGSEKDNEELGEEVRYMNDGTAQLYIGMASVWDGYIRVYPGQYTTNESYDPSIYVVDGTMDREVLTWS